MEALHVVTRTVSFYYMSNKLRQSFV